MCWNQVSLTTETGVEHTENTQHVATASWVEHLKVSHHTRKSDWPWVARVCSLLHTSQLIGRFLRLQRGQLRLWASWFSQALNTLVYPCHLNIREAEAELQGWGQPGLNKTLFQQVSQRNTNVNFCMKSLTGEVRYLRPLNQSSPYWLF